MSQNVHVFVCNFTAVISYHRGAQMGYEIYAVHRGATRRGQNKSLKMVFNKAFKIVEKLH